MLVSILTAAILGAFPAQAQDPGTASTRLEDLVVDGRPLVEATREFVGSVSAATRGRGLARWESSMCVGVANVRAEIAQPIADRISTVAEGLGVRAGEPGCRPNVVIVLTDDPSGFAQAYLDRVPRHFRLYASSTSQGQASLRRFLEEDRPVRWWQVSMPTHSETGERAVRIPFLDVWCDTAGPSTVIRRDKGSPFGCAPAVVAISASRLSTVVRDDMERVTIVVDADRLDDLNLSQLSDYLAVVALAQVQEDVDVRGFDSVLNVFDDPSIPGLTAWDHSFLKALYEAKNGRISLSSQVRSVAEVMADEIRARDD